MRYDPSPYITDGAQFELAGKLDAANRRIALLKQDIERLREALDWYAQGVDSDTIGRYDGHNPEVLFDDGNRARKALDPDRS